MLSSIKLQKLKTNFCWTETTSNGIIGSTGESKKLADKKDSKHQSPTVNAYQNCQRASASDIYYFLQFSPKFTGSFVGRVSFSEFTSHWVGSHLSGPY